MRGGIWSEIFDRYKEQFAESIRMSPQLKKRIQTLEYDFKNLKQQAQNTCTDKECFKKIKEDFPYFNYFDETISVAFFVLIVLALFKKTVVNKWKIMLCNSSKKLLSIKHMHSSIFSFN